MKKYKLHFYGPNGSTFSVEIESDGLHSSYGDDYDYEDAEALAKIMFPAADFNYAEVLESKP